jgi:hypothetical protein
MIALKIVHRCRASFAMLAKPTGMLLEARGTVEFVFPDLFIAEEKDWQVPLSAFAAAFDTHATTPYFSVNFRPG